MKRDIDISAAGEEIGEAAGRQQDRAREQGQRDERDERSANDAWAADEE
jgi:hypothetical protein